jgi:hypothetical protein
MSTQSVAGPVDFCVAPAPACQNKFRKFFNFLYTVPYINTVPVPVPIVTRPQEMPSNLFFKLDFKFCKRKINRFRKYVPGTRAIQYKNILAPIAEIASPGSGSTTMIPVQSKKIVQTITCHCTVPLKI